MKAELHQQIDLHQKIIDSLRSLLAWSDSAEWELFQRQLLDLAQRKNQDIKTIKSQEDAIQIASKVIASNTLVDVANIRAKWSRDLQEALRLLETLQEQLHSVDGSAELYTEGLDQ